MNVLLISMCDKRALTESRRILDQFAERRGDRTWQTPITQDGLDTLRAMLRRTARRNTAVACHWIRGHDCSELLWIVGDASRFNALGAVPTNTTERNVLRQKDENDWHSAEDIKLLAAMAALFHDFGKANVFFQRKLESAQKLADPYRHEWVSLRLFQAFVGRDNQDDREWLTRLSAGGTQRDTAWRQRLLSDGAGAPAIALGLNHLPPLARTVGWLVLTHHRLPAPLDARSLRERSQMQVLTLIEQDWCGSRVDATDRERQDCWKFAGDLPDASANWRARAAALAQRMLLRGSLFERDWLVVNPYVVHLSRLTLMLADHHYSSLKATPGLGDPGYKVYANTRIENDKRLLNQRLDEHLIGVEKHAQRIARSLPRLAEALPRIARHKGFKRRAGHPDFRWQDQAFDLACSLQVRSVQQGFFGVNMASTGCGKTLANGRIMYGLSDPQKGARFNIALGLRTLTLQTGDAYRTRLGLDEADMAVLVGSTAVRQLFELQQQEKAEAERQAKRCSAYDSGSESAADLLPDNTHVHFEGQIEAGPLSEWLASRSGRQASASALVSAPILVCTVDHLMPACESTRGGHQIAPMLRLLTSDLVLDEPDDFGIEDLPALSRLVHLAGLLGSRVLLSSATLPPALIEGLLVAYLKGRAHYQQNRGQPGLATNVCCAWFDEFGVAASDHADASGFAAAHADFVRKRIVRLAAKPVRRRAEIVPVPIATGKPETVRPALARLILPLLQRLHRTHHSIDPHSGKRVSFGLLRMANIDPLIDVVQALFALPLAEGLRLHVCVYHSRHPLLVRSAIEGLLDRVLRRHQPEAVFDDPEMRLQLDANSETDQIFLIAASPACEVGRDHDYDWAVVEPSSMRSIIQLAGRIRRHREGPCESPNMLLLDCNRRALEARGQAAFVRPGFEGLGHALDAAFRLASSSLTAMLLPEEFEQVDSRPRMQARTPLREKHNLSDLEHARLGSLMLGLDSRERPVERWWTTPGHLCAIEQRCKPFRHDPQGREPFVLMPDAEGTGIDFCRFEQDGSLSGANSRLHPAVLPQHERIRSWAVPPYFDALEALAEQRGMDLAQCARRFGTIDLPAQGNELGWCYHPMLGFRRVL